MKELLTYKKFKSLAEAEVLMQILKQHQIEFQIEDISAPFDVTLTGGTDLEDKVAIKLDAEDFPKANAVIEELISQQTDNVQGDHYLYDFSDDELMEILEKYDEWGDFDYALAQKILEERGKPISEEQLAELKIQRINNLKTPIKAKSAYIVVGYFLAFFGGLIGLLMGYVFYNSKKTLPTGESVFTYDKGTRSHAQNILVISIVIIILALGLRIFKTFSTISG